MNSFYLKPCLNFAGSGYGRYLDNNSNLLMDILFGKISKYDTGFFSQAEIEGCSKDVINV